MPTEIGRTQSRKQVLDGVWVPVIDKISFIDTVNRAQETQYSYENTFNNASRAVHTEALSSADGSATLDVERIDKVKVLDKVDKGQEANFVLSNEDPPPANKDNIGGSNNHWKTQYVRYCQNNDPLATTWVDVEQILELHVLDGVNRGQESRFKLDGWPPSGPPIDGDDPFSPTFATCDMSLPVSNNSDAFPETPARLDPWQNIVNFGDRELNLQLGWEWVLDEATVDLPGTWGQPCSPVNEPAFWARPGSLSGIKNLTLKFSNIPGGNLNPALLSSVSGPPSVTSGNPPQSSGDQKISFGPPVSKPGPIQEYTTYAVPVIGAVCPVDPAHPEFPRTQGLTFPDQGPLYVNPAPSIIISAVGQFIIYNGHRYDAFAISSAMAFEGFPRDAPFTLAVDIKFK